MKVLQIGEAPLYLLVRLNRPHVKNAMDGFALGAAAIALAARISAQDSLATQLTKKVMHAPRDSHPLVEQLAQALLIESPEKIARMNAFLDKNRK
jgi:enoyl-CoA hydratase